MMELPLNYLNNKFLSKKYLINEFNVANYLNDNLASSYSMDGSEEFRLKNSFFTKSLKIPASDLTYFHKLSSNNPIAQYTLIHAVYSYILYKQLWGFEGKILSNNFSATHCQNSGVCLSFIVDKNTTLRTHLQSVKEEVIKAHSNSREAEIAFQESYDDCHYKLTFNSSNSFATLGIDCNINVNSQLDIDIEIIYSPDFIETSIVLEILASLSTILTEIDLYLDIAIKDLCLQTEAEASLILKDFNFSDLNLLDGRTVCELLEDQSKKTPNNSAMEYAGIQYTFGELSEKADKLASYLAITYRILKGDVVAVLLPKSDEAVVAFLAIIKLGAVYLPIDVSYPHERISYILKDSGASLAISTEEGSNLKVNTFVFNHHAFNGFDTFIKDYKINNSDPMYIIYTSGSTGTPKGVVVGHEGVANMAKNQIEQFKITHNDRILWLASMAFDASISELLMALLSGAVLVVPEQYKIAEPTLLGEFIKCSGVTVATFTPSYLEILGADDIAGLRCIISAGENAIQGNTQKVLQFGIDYYNAYGPTECSVCTTIYKVNIKDSHRARLPIGKPIANTKIYILDRFGSPVAVGVPGMIHIAGIGLAKGYQNLSSLTVEKFIENPFSNDQRLYITGDIGMWLPDGTIEFLGRGDNQVKIRGFRIELEEIEVVSKRFSDDIQQSLAHVHQIDGNKILCLYLVIREKIDLKLLEEFLRNTLPTYLIPNKTYIVDEFPYLTNGKIDRKKLEIQSREQPENEFTLPTTFVQEQLSVIWSGVLGLERISIHSDFFALGGHSLMVDQVLNRISKTLNSKITFREFLQDPTINGISNRINICDFKAIPAAPESHSYSLTPSQQRIWLNSEILGASSTYHMPVAVKMDGPLEVDKLEQAFRTLILRHESLRTSFKVIDSGMVEQIIVPNEELSFKINIIDALNLNGSVESYMSDLRNIPFDLSIAPLLKAYLITLNEQEHIFYMSLHHIISDGWSLKVLVSELSRFYNALVSNSPIAVPEPGIQFKDYVVWLRNQSYNNNYNSKLYWESQLSNLGPQLIFSSANPKSNIKQFKGKRSKRQFEYEFQVKIKQFADTNKVTLFATLMSAVKALVYRYTGENDILVGTPFAGRSHSDFENQIGLYLQTVPLRTKISVDWSFGDLVQFEKDVILGAYENQVFSFEDLGTDGNSINSRSAMLFDCFVIFQSHENLLSLKSDDFSGLEISLLDLDTQTSQFDLTFNFIETDGLALELEFNTDVYKDDVIDNILTHFMVLFERMISVPEEPISGVSFMSAYEVDQVLHCSNGEKVDYGEDCSIVDLFDRQVERMPDDIAVVFNNRRLSYYNINELANKFADYLQQQGLQEGESVGICMRRSDNLVVAILGVLKLGANYIPIDTDYPHERINYILNDSNCNIVITDSVYDIFLRNHDEYSSINPLKRRGSDSVLVCIYTSGSTGAPKGVEILDSNLINRIKWMWDAYPFSKDEVACAKTSISFVDHLWELFGPLLSGTSIVIYEKDLVVDLNQFIDTLTNDKITRIVLVPSLLKDILNHLNNNNDKHLSLQNLNLWISSGEALTVSEVQAFYKQFPNHKLLNIYGSSEVTADVTYFDTSTLINCSVAKKSLVREFVPIGRPISNSQVYVLDSSLLPVPVGIAGRLYVSGAGVARGYLHNAELTAARFLSDPFLPGQRMYDTGDLGRWHSDGTLEFMGRADHQVKIRGFRVEPGEVEHAIYGYGGDLEQVVVHALEHNGEKVLAAYLVGPSGVDKPALRSYLLSVLPEYMVPGFYIELDHLPLNPNGKTDRSRLPGISDDDVLRREYIAPSSALEQDLALIWQDVLGLERVGMRDNFFELGGHSLLIAQVINRISRQLGRSISFGGFFGNPTIEGLIGELRGQEYKAIVPAGPQESYPLTSSQRRLWILSQLEGGSLAYNMPFAVRLQGSFSLDKFRHAFAVLIDRHEILRTVFRSDAHGDIRQYILDAGECGFHIDYADYSMHGDAQQRAEDYLQASNSAFDLASGPLLGACVLCLGPDEHVFFLSMHHIISDGWSIELLASEVIKVYNSLVHGVEADLPSLPIQYKDYAVWLNESFSDPSYQSSGAYWREQFSGELPVLELPGFKGRPLVQSYRGDILTQHFSAAFLERLKSFSARHDATLFMGLLSGVKALLHRYSAQQDIIIGTPIAGREHPDLEGQLGLYVNTLAIRTRFDAQENFSGLLDKERSTLLGAYEHQSYPFDELVGQLNLKRDTGRSPLFDVTITLQSQAQLSLNTQTDLSDLSGLRAEGYDFNIQTSQFDLSFIFVEGDGLSLSIQYNTDIYDRWLIERMFGHFERLVTGMLDSPSQYIGTIDYLSAAEREQVVYGFNATSAEYGSGKTVVDLFEAQALQAPDSIAVVFEGSTLTYGKLNERSNQLAGYLRSAYGISGDDFVGVKLPRSEKMIVAILGILKAGGAYVPIDTAYPADRIAYMEQDSNCRVVLDEEELMLFDFERFRYPVDNLAQSCTPSSLAYLIYTSGSTGRPKGVMVEHGNIVRLVQACHYFTLDSSTVLLSTGSVSFDATILEFFGTLLNGGKLILTADLLDLSATGSLMGEQQVNSLWMTASWFNDVVDSHIGFFENIRQLIVGGDVVSEAHVRKVFAHYPSIRIINGYGPTENTTFSATYEITDREYGTTIPIGRPISNSQVYVLDSSLLPVPVGIAGRLYVSGAGVARGYLHNAELTAARFLSDPFLPGQRMYDTGDLGRWHSDGTLEFMGRADHQVKIRGFRVEPGEVEHAIYGYGGDFEQVVVHALEHNGEKVLAAYLVGPSGVDKPALRSYLLSVLPEYMVPGFYIELDYLPLNPNGKTDRSRLPGISDDDVLRREYIAPSSALEQDLALIWQDVLGLERVGMRDNFFELGGHSLVMVQVINRISRQLGRSISFGGFFGNPTIEGLIGELRGQEYKAIVPAGLQESYPLTSSQRRLWILSQLEGGSLAYNMPFAVRLQGSFSLDKFRHAFAVLIDRHEILRTVFRSDAHGDIRQYILDAGECGFHIDYADYSMHGDAQQRAEDYLQASNSAFDLASGPLLGACVLCLGPDEHVFFLSMHHIISDGWSIELLASEVIKVYNSLVHGVEADLPSLPIQYKDYAVWLNESFSDPSYQSSGSYWREQFSGELPVLELPGFKGRPLVQSYRGDILTQHFSAAFLERIKSFSARHDATLFMGLLSGVKALLHRYSAQQDIIIGTPIAGREHPDLEGQLGLYLNTLAIRTRFDAQENFSGLLDKERSTLLGAYEHQSYPFDELVGQLNLKRDTGRSPLFDVMVVLQSQAQLSLNTQTDLSGLRAESYAFRDEASKFDLNFIFVESDGLSLSIQYNTDIYDRWLIERMFGHFERLVTGMLDSPSQYIGTIDYLSATEREQVVYGFNATSAEYGSGKTVVDLFEAQALQAPDSIAVVFEGSTLTYGKLNERSNQLAGYLRSAYGISGDDFVGVKLPRSEKMIVAILGILKAGGAYVPIDTAYPADRIAYMEQDSNCRVVLDEGEWDKFTDAAHVYPVDNLAQSCTPSSLAYLIYTSGSTGRPKGVMVEHGNIVRLVQACHYFTLDSSTVLLSTGSVSFDATILEFFGTLLNGGKLILTADLLDLSATGSLMGEQQVNSLWMTASWFNDVVDSHIGFFENIRQLIVGGDVVSEAHVRKVFAHYPSIRIINGYGPTENTTFSATYEITDREYGTTIPIGRPISNSQAYVLDSSLLPVPVGIAGRLYVSGAGVARGYLHNAELTAARFLSDPFLPGQRMYDTGDLGRWHSDGTLEFMGRADHQVKIRGFRVEPGEVEHAIYGYGGDFEQVVVHALEHNGEKVLAAYLVGPSGVDKPALRSYLLSVLPEYMVPGFYIELDHLPLNPNGKTDRSRLPGISDDDVLRREYIAPSSALEQDLALIWQDVLGLERVGMRDNFFELGGHSMAAIKLVHRMNEKFNISFTISNILVYPTIEKICRLISILDNSQSLTEQNNNEIYKI